MLNLSSRVVIKRRVKINPKPIHQITETYNFFKGGIVFEFVGNQLINFI